MFIKELWRYPVKSLAGEQVKSIEVGPNGMAGDRTVLVTRNGRVVTSRTHHRLLGLKGTMNEQGIPLISGHVWNSTEALALARKAAGPEAELVQYQGVERFDVLPILVATDGAVQHLGLDRRRFRPNIVIGGVDGLEERRWPGRRLRSGDVILHAAQLRSRCVMTTYDPDSLDQDPNVLRRIVDELGGRLGLDCAVDAGGILEEGAPVFLEGDNPPSLHEHAGAL
jgi:uncharacterized protein YcbX